MRLGGSPCATVPRAVVACAMMVCATLAVTTLAVTAAAGELHAQSSRNPADAVRAVGTVPTDVPVADSTRDAAATEARPRVFALPTRRWMPRHISLGVGGVATSTPVRGTTYSPTMGGMFDLSLIGYLTPRVTWRAEGFLHLHDRSRASETALLAEPAEGRTPCNTAECTENPRETSRRSSGGALGVEYHPMRGGFGVYGVALLGVARSNSSGEAGDQLGLAPSAGIGVLAPMSAGLDGFAVELRWRRIPTALGAVNAAVASLQLRF